jgi:hypothetical protein
MLDAILYAGGALLFVLGTVTPLMLDSKAGRDARRKGAIR